jgi:hypothetical protein
VLVAGGISNSFRVTVQAVELATSFEVGQRLYRGDVQRDANPHGHERSASGGERRRSLP